ncbi:uncharacterized protein E0L32_011990 [Thyridium curvatum]|uniref:Uncharacterized protein n=1 Tax=Thyridium curvatum TaxID=1093900 RepID=A0A507BDC6_9PEZI|nr:uncharacterized protein E0L32_011990 [Thyridium curvatum]TPX17927.1 hypothetical protein E0L32_011990 [Thyridium curvatum]
MAKTANQRGSRYSILIDETAKQLIQKAIKQLKSLDKNGRLEDAAKETRDDLVTVLKDLHTAIYNHSASTDATYESAAGLFEELQGWAPDKAPEVQDAMDGLAVTMNLRARQLMAKN